MECADLALSWGLVSLEINFVTVGGGINDPEFWDNEVFHEFSSTLEEVDLQNFMYKKPHLFSV